MKKVLVLFLVVVLTISLIFAAKGEENNFSVREYFESFENLESMPEFPSFGEYINDNLDGDIDSEKHFWDKAITFFKMVGNFFVFLYNVVAYPIKIIIWIISSVGIIFGGAA